MRNWFWKKLGYHVCEEFTQWTDRNVKFLHNNRIGGIIVDSCTSIEHWQERRCTICGRIEQRKLEV